MSIELSRDANRLLEDIELELASIRASMAMRALDAPQPVVASAAPAPSFEPPARAIGPFDPAPSRPALAPQPQGAETPKRMTLQQRLAAMSEDD